MLFDGPLAVETFCASVTFPPIHDFCECGVTGVKNPVGGGNNESSRIYGLRSQVVRRDRKKNRRKAATPQGELLFVTTPGRSSGLGDMTVEKRLKFELKKAGKQAFVAKTGFQTQILTRLLPRPHLLNIGAACIECGVVKLAARLLRNNHNGTISNRIK